MHPNVGDTHFGSFRLSVRERRLLQNGQEVPLTPKAFDTLHFLVTHAGNLVERQDLIKAVWGDVFVDESTLTQNIFTIRKALGDGVFVETVPRRGYRFTASVTTPEAPLDPAAVVAGEPGVAYHRKKNGFIWTTAAVAAAAVGVVLWINVGLPSRNPLDGATFRQFTNFEGDELNGAISPDGKFVGFISDRNGSFNNWVGPVASENKEFWSKFGPTGGNQVRFLGFSPDGRVWHEELPTSPREKSSMRITPLTGGPSKPFLEVNDSEPAWSADGKRLVYHSSNDGDTLFVSDRTGTNRKTIFGKGKVEAGMHNHLPAWSPDGGWIYFTRGVLTTRKWDIWRVPSSGGAGEQMTRHNSEVAYPNPIDNRNVLYTARDEKGLGPWLWALDVETKKTRRISSGAEVYIGLSATADGRRLAATIAKPSVSLWTVPILDHVAEEADAKPFSMPHERAGAPRFGGERLFLLSSLGGGDGLWQYRDKKLTERWSGIDGPLFDPPVVSRNGQQVAIVLRQNGQPVWNVGSAEGPGFRAIGESLEILGSGEWAPDGKSFLAGGSDASGKPGLFKIPLEGGAPIRVISGGAFNPAWSAEANLIVYAGAGVKGWADLHFVRANDGSPLEFPPIRVNAASSQAGRFLPDGKGMIYRVAQDFWFLDLSTHQIRQLTRFNSTRIIGSFDITPDGKQIVFDRVRQNSDIYLIDLPAKL